MTTIDPAALPASVDPLAGFSPEQIEALTALLTKRAEPVNTIDQSGPTAAPDTDAPHAVESSPEAAASVAAPASSVPVPPLASIVHQSYIAPGSEHPTDRYGVVVTVDDSQNVAGVVWFLTEPINVTGDAITKVG